MPTFPGTPNNDQMLAGWDSLVGANGNDNLAQSQNTNGDIQGQNGDDILYFYGNGGGKIQGGEGNDNIQGAERDDHLYGDSGDDYISGNGGRDDIYGSDGRDALSGGDGDDLVFGGPGDDGGLPGSSFGIQSPVQFRATGAPGYASVLSGLSGGDGEDYLDGEDGNDTVSGNNGVDVLVGGLGADWLIGGEDGDIFTYFSFKESKRGGKADLIEDFQPGFDTIDLREVDANRKKDGNQKFKFIGKKGFHDKAGELRFKDGEAYADVSGDGKTDFQIHFHNDAALGRGDFNL